MLNAVKYRDKALTIFAAIALLILFTIAIAAPVMSHDHVENCVIYEDEGNCIFVKEPKQAPPTDDDPNDPD